MKKKISLSNNIAFHFYNRDTCVSFWSLNQITVSVMPPCCDANFSPIASLRTVNIANHFALPVPPRINSKDVRVLYPFASDVVDPWSAKIETFPLLTFMTYLSAFFVLLRFIIVCIQ